MSISFPASLPVPLKLKRTLRAGVTQRIRGDGTIERTFVSGHIQHAFDLPFPALRASQSVTLSSFFNTCQGRYANNISYLDPFPLEQALLTCRLDQDELEMTEIAPNLVWSSSLKLLEIANWQAIKAAVPVFPATTVPIQQLGEGFNYRTEIQATDDFAEHVYQDYGPINRWSVGGDALTNAQALLLLLAWEGNCGPWMEMQLTDPVTAVVYNHVHFVETELIHTMIAPGVNSIRLQVEQDAQG